MPVRSIVLQGVWTSALVLWGNFETLVKYASTAMILGMDQRWDSERGVACVSRGEYCPGRLIRVGGRAACV